jgi:general secretion pathway protein A
MKRSATRRTAKTVPAASVTTTPSEEPFPYGDYVEAKARIEAAIRRGLFYGWVSGPTGTGKTSLMRELRQALDRHRHNVVYLSATSVSTVGIARHFAQAIHVTPRRSALETSRLITQAIRDQGVHVIAWIDEAHRLSPDTLAEINSLAEFDPDASQVFSVVFSGPAELLSLFDDRRLSALKRRVTIRCALAGLRREELEPFLIHRFGTADEDRIARDARDELFERTQGAPAIIDAVVRAALERTRGAVTEDVLREVLDARAF